MLIEPIETTWVTSAAPAPQPKEEKVPIIRETNDNLYL